MDTHGKVNGNRWESTVMGGSLDGQKYDFRLTYLDRSFGDDHHTAVVLWVATRERKP